MLTEHHQQTAILISWPHNNCWKENKIDIETTFTELVNIVSPSQKILILCKNNDISIKVRKKFINSPHVKNIVLHIVETNDIWIRDYGPLFCNKNGLLVLNEHKFNSWGNKYSHDHDMFCIANLYKKKIINADEKNNIDLTFEGGNLEVNNQLMISSRNCFFHKNRNNNLAQSKVEEIFNHFFNINRFWWIENSKLFGDDTDGHIDNLVRFINSDTLCIAYTDNKSDPNFNTLQKLYQEVCKLNNKRYNLVKIPMPEIIYYEGDILPASYLNFVITNKLVIVPTFDQENDQEVLEILQRYTNKKVVKINALNLVKQGGGIHCSTINIPKI